MFIGNNKDFRLPCIQKLTNLCYRLSVHLSRFRNGFLPFHDTVFWAFRIQIFILLRLKIVKLNFSRIFLQAHLHHLSHFDIQPKVKMEDIQRMGNIEYLSRTFVHVPERPPESRWFRFCGPRIDNFDLAATPISEAEILQWKRNPFLISLLVEIRQNEYRQGW